LFCGERGSNAHSCFPPLKPLLKGIRLRSYFDIFAAAFFVKHAEISVLGTCMGGRQRRAPSVRMVFVHFDAWCRVWVGVRG
jgi:hypothetical protein